MLCNCEEHSRLHKCNVFLANSQLYRKHYQVHRNRLIFWHIHPCLLIGDMHLLYILYLHTVKTGFQANEITLLENSQGMMCLNTVETVFRDTLINVTLIGGSAGAEGDVIQCGCMLILYKRNVMYQLHMSVLKACMYKKIY